MAVNPLGMNQGTQNFIRFEDDGGTVLTQVVDIRQGTIALTGGGTTVTVDHGTVTLSNPTGTTVQFNNGTVDLLKAGTITRVEGGTVGLVTTVSNLTNGSVRVTLGTTVAGTLNLLDTVTNLTSGSVRMTVGTLTVMPNIPGGTVNLVTTVSNLTAGSVAVTAGTIASLVPGTAATQLGKQEDGAHTSGDVGVMMLGVRQDSQSDFGADGDYVPLSIDADGQVRTSATFSGTLESTVGTIAEVTNLVGGTVTSVEGGSITMIANTEKDGSGTAFIPVVTENGHLVTYVDNFALGAFGTNNAISPSLTSALVYNNNYLYDAGGTVWRRQPGDSTDGALVNLGSNNDVVVTAGTITAGTVQLNPYPNVNILVGGTTSAGTIGTIVAAPAAGTQVVVTGFHVLQVSGTAETVVSFGLQAAGNQVLARGNYAAGGGITETDNFPSAYGATGTALTWNMLSGSGTVSYKVKYYLR